MRGCNFIDAGTLAPVHGSEGVAAHHRVDDARVVSEPRNRFAIGNRMMHRQLGQTSVNG
jgi:hypothetical protein